ncbi:hypothetical protein MAPG_02677 [Magnaporthiopsis poae ATCC 64411]|uniref:Heterokaryon incompatibility domain-containing protein n=1 Tax=Magnaporthiopsis poae (strain ATCC 64411 / 73-15) TaxID=644358 RepID=A0A0C4DS08_MAGP6|nr:hypothetical protein MAPG_02677 [Magnaporthiopsis poae ATCC 64411]
MPDSLRQRTLKISCIYGCQRLYLNDSRLPSHPLSLSFRKLLPHRKSALPYLNPPGFKDIMSMELMERVLEQSRTTSPSAPENSLCKQFYRNHPLRRENEEIRVLHLDPPSDGKLVGHLGVVSLKANSNDRPKFAALSYVWRQPVDGETDQPRTIRLSDAFELEITTNCYAALQQIQNNQHNLGAIPIWIDSICINQMDKAEREWQVNDLMGRVYTLANSVYIWLGQGTKGTDRAMDYLGQYAAVLRRLPIAEYATAGGITGLDREIDDCRSKAKGDYLRRLSLVATSFRWWRNRQLREDINELLSMPWISRVWTFQEITLAYHPVVLCGDHVLTWGDMVNALRYPVQSPSRIPYASIVGPFRHPERGFASWRMIIRFWLVFRRPFPRASSLIAGHEAGGGGGNPEAGRLNPQSFFEIHNIMPTTASATTRRRWRLLLRLAIAFVFVMLFLVTQEVRKLDTAPTIFAMLAMICIYAAGGWVSAKGLGFVIFGRSESVLELQMHQEDAKHGHLVLLAAIQRALRYRACAVEHDRAYGLWGILKALEVKLPDVDYNQGVGVVYSDLLAIMVKWQPAAVGLILDAGTIQSGRDPLGDAPSWVPRWTGGSEHIPSPWMSMKYNARFQQPALLPASQSAYPVIEGRFLRLLGRPHGVVQFITAFDNCVNPPPPTTSHKRSFLHWVQHAEDSIRRGREVTPPNPSVKTLLRYYRHPVCSVYAVAKGLALEWRQSAVLWRDWHGTPIRFKRLHHAVVGTNPAGAARSDIGVGIAPNDDVCTIIERVSGANDLLNKLVLDLIKDKRCLFVLSNGLVGSGPLGMLDGDEVFLLQGVQTPMALRRTAATTAETYTVVGAVLVHGIMHRDYLSRTFDDNARSWYTDGMGNLPQDVDIPPPHSWDKEITIT